LIKLHCGSLMKNFNIAMKRRPEFAAWQPDFDNISVKLSSDLLPEI